MVIAHEVFRDEEFLEPREILRNHTIGVTVASTDLSPATGKLGAKVKPDILLRDVRASDFDAVVFIGGGGAACYFNDPYAHRLIKDAVSLGKVVAAICIAPVILAKAGVLKGKRATCWPSEGDTLKTMGATYTGGLVERDGLIITGNGPGAAQAFGQALAEALQEK